MAALPCLLLLAPLTAADAGLLVRKPAEGHAAADDSEDETHEEATEVRGDPGAQRQHDADDRVEQALRGVEEDQQTAHHHQRRQHEARQALHTQVHDDLQGDLHRDEDLDPAQGEQQPAQERTVGPPASESGPHLLLVHAQHQQPDSLKLSFSPGSLNTAAVVA